jgi:hypothetical protein
MADADADADADLDDVESQADEKEDNDDDNENEVVHNDDDEVEVEDEDEAEAEYLTYERLCANTPFQDAPYRVAGIYCSLPALHAVLGPPTDDANADAIYGCTSWSLRFACGTVVRIERPTQWRQEANQKVTNGVFSNSVGAAFVVQLLRRLFRKDLRKRNMHEHDIWPERVHGLDDAGADDDGDGGADDDW